MADDRKKLGKNNPRMILSIPPSAYIAQRYFLYALVEYYHPVFVEASKILLISLAMYILRILINCRFYHTYHTLSQMINL